MAPYINSGPVDTTSGFETDSIRGKTAIVTGGANGIGAEYVRRLVAAGAFVVIGDLDEAAGKRFEEEHAGACKFVKCDMTKWQDQLAMFRTALSSSPAGKVDVVIANAGISGYDSVFFNDIDPPEPEEPRLNIANVNLLGVLYTVKLALFYFRKQHAAAKKEENPDHVLILGGSIAGYIDFKAGVQYTAAKHGLRGMMGVLRRTERQYNTRVNYIAPWFLATKLMSDEVMKHLNKSGIEFAHLEDAGQAVMRIIADPSINGRAFAILPRSIVASGHVDIDHDDFEEGSLMAKMQYLSQFANHRAQLSAASQKTSTLWERAV